MPFIEKEVPDKHTREVARLFRPIKQRSYALLHVRPGISALDVGCGEGVDTLAMGERIGPTGRVVGVDRDQETVTAANRRIAQNRLSDFIEHRQGDVLNLPCEDEAFDACRCERVLDNLEDPAEGLRELLRVTKSGGQILVAEVDWGSLSINCSDPDLEERLRRGWAEHTLRSGYIGRKLVGLLGKHLLRFSVECHTLHTDHLELARRLISLEEIEIAAVERRQMTADELNTWRSHLEDDAREERFYASVGLVMLYGQRE